jgi:SecD/SecF fusion protein
MSLKIIFCWINQFVNAYAGKEYGILQAVGPTVAKIKTDLLGCSWSYGDCVLYLMISFRKWQYSLGAIAAVA